MSIAKCFFITINGAITASRSVQCVYELNYFITKDHNFDLTDLGIETRAAGLQSSALPSELYDLNYE